MKARTAPGEGGETGDLLRARDWSATPLGPSRAWPEQLKTLIAVMLGSAQPMYVAWGPERILIYNDAYAPLCGARHPEAFGRPFAEVWWDAVETVGPVLEEAFAGRTHHQDDLTLKLARNGGWETAYFSFSFTPVRDDDGRVLGVLCVCQETTRLVQAQRRDAFRAELGDALRAAADPDSVMRTAAELLGRHLDCEAVGYSDVDETDQVHIRQEWRSGALPSLSGVYPLAAFGSVGRALKTGRTVAIADIRMDEDWADARDATLALGVLAAIDAPVVRDGRLSGVLFVHSAETRAWKPEELILVEETAARTWSAVFRRRAEEAARIGEREMRLITDSLPVLISYVDREERYRFNNRAYEEWFGVDRRTMYGRTIREVLGDAAYASVKPYVDRVLGGERFSFESRMDYRDAGRRDIQVEYVPRRAEDGTVEGFYGLVQDVGERRRTEAALRESEARFRNMADHAPVMMWVTDDSGYCTYLNEAWYDFTGQTPEEAEGFGWVDATHPDDKAMAHETFVNANAARAPFRVEYRLRRKDGTYRWAIDAAAPRFGPDGDFLGYVGSVIDIDDRREAEDRVKDSEARLSLALGAGRAGVFEWRIDTDVNIWSPELEALYGVAPGGFEGNLEAWRSRVVAEDAERVVAGIAACLERKEVGYDYEFRAVMPGGAHRWLRGASRFDYGPDGEPLRMVGINVDIHDRKTAELELQRLNETLEHRVQERTRELIAAEEALRQAQKMEAIGQLTGGVAHDFNNLLTVIRSSADLLRRRELTEERRRRYVDAISDTADRAAKLTGQLLAFARRQALKPEPFDVAARVEGVAEMLKTVMGARVALELRIDPGLAVEADPAQFETALVNMAVNARDAMAGEGRLTVTVGTEGDDFVAVTVEDTGPGIAPDALPRIFEPFFTTKDLGKGTGLGLSQVYGFAKQSGGEITVCSEPGRGAAFTLTLPRVPADRLPASATRVRSVDASQGHGRVLVVEDNAQVGEFACQLLNDLGYLTTHAPDAHAALALLEQDSRAFDLVFSDVVMPGMGGVELGRTLRERFPHLPIVLTSGYSHVLAEDARHGFPLLHKPYSVEELSRVLRRAGAGAQAPAA